MRTCQEIITRRRELWETHHDIERDSQFIQAAAEHFIEPENAAIREEINRYPEYLIEMFFVIVDKDMNTVPFFLNEVQRSFLNDINKAKEEYQKGERLHLKFLVLKGRQQGFTSFITAYQLANALINKNFSGFTLADSGDNTNTIFEDKAKYIYNQLPEVLQPSIKYNNRREFHFDVLNSRWRVNTAGNKDVGRSKTINFFHGSEAAFWSEMQSIIAGLGQALTKDSIQILETTADGFNEYKDLWDGENNWENKFYVWWRTAEYRLPFTVKGKEEFIQAVNNFGSQPSSELRKIFEKIKRLRKEEGLDWEQLNWYYNKWKDLKDELDQEYPCYPEEAFLATGKPIFDKEKVIARIEELRKRYKTNEPLRGDFIWDVHGEQIWDNSIRFVPDESGFITLYKQPSKGRPYVIGGDIAEGGADFSSGQVLDNITGDQVAVWHGHIDTDLFAKYMYCLGKYYNDALIAIEMNFDLHPVKELTRLNYYKQYRRENVDSNHGDKQDDKFGFRTTSITRPVIISNLVTVVRESIETINDILTLQEMLTFVRNDKGKPEAITGKHDDTIMALAIAHKARDQQSMSLATEEAWSAIPEALPGRRSDFDDDDDDDMPKVQGFW
ncbi:hypothetical protein [Paenibacillus bouchesdurhonensis]|uniref:hypothetical protein n=1 Tax=Paenibacillus bouchesdurhonensis TaxID=1870990 RepID=UPI000DA622DA|nr:hypothetical protein [Paenibacillus bouchesdurhonensis]